MNKEQAEQKVMKLLSERKNKVVGRNIVSAALSLFSNPAMAVDKLFFGIDTKMSDEKLKLEQDLILDLICQMSDSLDNIQKKFNSKYNGEKSVMIDGIIEVNSKDSETVTGVFISKDSGQVEFKHGTKISVTSENSKNTTGLKIGE